MAFLFSSSPVSRFRARAPGRRSTSPSHATGFRRQLSVRICDLSRRHRQTYWVYGGDVALSVVACATEVRSIGYAGRATPA